ncbi:MAG: thiol-disulfide oxidoreductase DCC family protein [Bacteriovoracaceae bacterium]
MESMKAVLIYDAECPLCARFKQGLELMDTSKKLRFVPLQDAQLFEEFPELNQEDCKSQVHLITEERKVLKGSEVVDYLIKSLPGVSKLSWLLDSESGKKATQFFYQKVEELREILKEKEDCNQCPHDHKK